MQPKLNDSGRDEEESQVDLRYVSRISSMTPCEGMRDSTRATLLSQDFMAKQSACDNSTLKDTCRNAGDIGERMHNVKRQDMEDIYTINTIVKHNIRQLAASHLELGDVSGSGALAGSLSTLPEHLGRLVATNTSTPLTTVFVVLVRAAIGQTVRLEY